MYYNKTYEFRIKPIDVNMTYWNNNLLERYPSTEGFSSVQFKNLNEGIYSAKPNEEIFRYLKVYPPINETLQMKQLLYQSL